MKPRRIRERKRGPDVDLDRWVTALRDARVPERYWPADPSQIEPEKLRRWVENTIETAPAWLAEGRGWYLMGDLNAGKSSIAALLLMEALKRCERCLWMPVRDVPTAAFREGERGEDLNWRLHNCDVLVLDDLGSERFRLRSAAGAALEETARIMYDRGRSLIVTANLSWRQFSEHYKAEAEPFVSVMRRMVEPYHVQNEQWGFLADE